MRRGIWSPWKCIHAANERNQSGTRPSLKPKPPAQGRLSGALDLPCSNWLLQKRKISPRGNFSKWAQTTLYFDIRQQKYIISMHSLKQSLCRILVQVTAPRLKKHPIFKVHDLLFLLFHSDIFYDADAMTSRSMTCDQSSSHKDAHALNTTMQQQASSQWSTEGLQNQSQRSGVMSLDTVLSQQNKASAIFMWPFMWAMQKYWWLWVEISSVVKTECCQQLSTFTKAHEASKNIPK